MELRSEDMGYIKIAEWLREHAYKTVRGKKVFVPMPVSS